MSNEKILIVEDEEAIRELIKMTLELNGFSSVFEAGNGENAITFTQRHHPDLILLDLMLPGVDGLNVCRILKSNPETAAIPIIMLTAKSEESDIVTGLELGACDYITKPFSNKVLVARVRAQLRKNVELSQTRNIKVNELFINIESRSVVLNDMPVDLTFSEFEMLVLLARHPGRVYTRNQIVAKIKGEDYPVTERAIDVQVVNLRKKLGGWGSNIETVRGVGYRLKNQIYLGE